MTLRYAQHGWYAGLVFHPSHAGHWGRESGMLYSAIIYGTKIAILSVLILPLSHIYVREIKTIPPASEDHFRMRAFLLGWCAGKVIATGQHVCFEISPWRRIHGQCREKELSDVGVQPLILKRGPRATHRYRDLAEAHQSQGKTSWSRAPAALAVSHWAAVKTLQFCQKSRSCGYGYGNRRLQTAQHPFRDRQQHQVEVTAACLKTPRLTLLKRCPITATPVALLTRRKALTLLSYETFKHMVNHVHAQACFTGNHVAQPGALSFTTRCPIVTKVT